MAFDQDKWREPAVQGQVAGAHVEFALAMNHIVNAFEKIEAKTGVDLADERRELLALNRSSFKTFQTLTGWKSDDGD